MSVVSIPKKPALLLLERGGLRGVKVTPSSWEKFCFCRELASETPWETGDMDAVRIAAELRRSFAAATGMRGAKAVADAVDRGSAVAFHDERLRISYVVDMAQFCLRSVCMADLHRSLRLPNPRFGAIGVTFHAWERFRERYPATPQAPVAPTVEGFVRAIRDSFARARHEVLDFGTTAIRKVAHPMAGEVRYYRDRRLDLRYVVAEEKRLLLTVEIPVARPERAHAIPPHWEKED